MASSPEVLGLDLNEGTRVETEGGYIRVRWPHAYDMEHRIVLAQKLGRPLGDRESAHHKNGLRHDNRPENLELWVGPIRSGVRGYDLECPHCNKRYYDEST